MAYSVLSGRTQEEIARNLPARKTKRETAGAADRVWATSPPAKRARAKISEGHQRVGQPLPHGGGSDQGAVAAKPKYDLASPKDAAPATRPATLRPIEPMV